jgi:hypothetical protein
LVISNLQPVKGRVLITKTRQQRSRGDDQPHQQAQSVAYCRSCFELFAYALPARKNWPARPLPTSCLERSRVLLERASRVQRLCPGSCRPSAKFLCAERKFGSIFNVFCNCAAASSYRRAWPRNSPISTLIMRERGSTPRRAATRPVLHLLDQWRPG